MSVLAWHFSDGPQCRYDNRPIVAGETLKIDGDPVLCSHGLHASTRITDALDYATGSWVWRVEVGGTVIRGDDKIVGTTRRALWGFDADDLLWDYARRCALDVIDLWNPPDVVVRYLKTGDEELRDAARDAAWGAARDAAWGAADAAWGTAWDAAWGAAWAAARGDAWAAAGAAAGAAARAAARDAARDAAGDKQNRRLSAMVVAEAKRRGTK